MLWLSISLFIFSLIVTMFVNNQYWRRPPYERAPMWRNPIVFYTIGFLPIVAMLSSIALAFVYTDYGWWFVGAIVLVFVL